jgi:hypothetical protein
MTKMGLSTTKGAAWDAAAPRCGAALTWYGILLATPMSEKYAAPSSPAAGEEQKKRTLPHGRKREELRYLFSPSRLLRCSFLPCSV